jgi:hypothetical protein
LKDGWREERKKTVTGEMDEKEERRNNCKKKRIGIRLEKVKKIHTCLYVK